MTALDGVAPLAGTTRVGTLLSIAERCGAADAEAVGAGARSASGTVITRGAMVTRSAAAREPPH